MRLEQYLELLRNCPDDLVRYEYLGNVIESPRLQAELGIGDNWPIRLRTDYETTARHLKGSTGTSSLFSRQYKFLSEGKKGSSFEYDSVDIRLYTKYGIFSHNLMPEDEHAKKQVENYNFTIMLHPDNLSLYPIGGSKLPYIDRLRKMAEVIDDLCTYAIKQKIPLCLPDSLGWKNRWDFSEIVYYEPDIE